MLNSQPIYIAKKLPNFDNVKFCVDVFFYAVFTENCIAAQTFTFIAGGSETTATVLSYAMYELAANQDVQKRLQDVVDTVLSSKEFYYNAVKEMTYMDQFFWGENNFNF